MIQPMEDGAGRGGARGAEVQEGAGRLDEGGAVESVETFGGGGDGGKGRGRGGGGGSGRWLLLLLVLGGQEGMERPVDHDDDWCGGACTSTCARAGDPSSITSSGNFLAHNQSDAMGGLASFVFGACLQELLLPVVAV